MIINVQFRNKTSGKFGGMLFSYNCDLTDVRVGDIVKAPTARGETEAKVAAVDVPRDSVDAGWLAMLKTITEFADAVQVSIADVETEEGEIPSQSPEVTAPIAEEPMTAGEPVALAVTADIIQVKQLPIIEEQLRSVKMQVEALTQEAAAMVCTDDTVKAVKAKRAELNRMFDQLEAKRKDVKSAVMGPYERFDAVYRECISGPFKRADAALKDKVDYVEAELKRACEEKLRVYFDGLLVLHGVDFVTYEQAGVKVDMASARAKTPQKLKDKLNEFVAGVAECASQLRQMDDRDEIMAEYKKCLNVGSAIAIVQERHRRIEEERKAAEERETRRKRQEEAVAKVEAVAPPVVATEPPKPASTEKVFPRFTFTVLNATKSQLIKVREFMKQEGIQYE